MPKSAKAFRISSGSTSGNVVPVLCAIDLQTTQQYFCQRLSIRYGIRQYSQYRTGFSLSKSLADLERFMASVAYHLHAIWNKFYASTKHSTWLRSCGPFSDAWQPGCDIPGEVSHAG